MNKFIKEQLSKCKMVLPSWDDSTIQLIIPKNSPKQVEKLVDFQEGLCYNIIVEDYIIHPYVGFTLHDNWNKGIAPTDKEMNCVVLKIMGKMVQINATGVNDNSQWTGWLPIKSCKIIKEI